MSWGSGWDWAKAQLGHNAGAADVRTFDRIEHTDYAGPVYTTEYCAIFVVDFLDKVGWTAPPWITAYGIRDWGQEHHCFHSGTVGLQRGDIVVMSYGAGHVGVATGPAMAGGVPVLEGNTRVNGVHNLVALQHERVGFGSAILGYVRVPQVAHIIHHEDGGHDGLAGAGTPVHPTSGQVDLTHLTHDLGGLLSGTDADGGHGGAHEGGGHDGGGHDGGGHGF